MKTFGIYANLSKPDIATDINRFASALKKYGFEVLYSAKAAELCDGIAAAVPLEDVFSKTDAVIVIGGDGTVLTAAQYAIKYDVSLLGVNRGHLGYITELEASETEYLNQLAEGNFSIEKRLMLDGRIIRGNKTVEVGTALNEFVVSRGNIARIVNLELWYRGHIMCSYRSDALIVATPTGSTAYSLAAGGPIIDPCFDSICVCPVCSHSLNDTRPIIFSPDETITVTADASDDVWLTADGKTSHHIEHGDRIEISASSKSLKLIKLKSRPFFDSLRSKLV